MKETITRYYCDRCGAEFRPYGTANEITNGFGTVRFHLSALKEHPYSDEIPREKELCPECFDGLINYLNINEED